MNAVQLACDSRIHTISVESILPLRKLAKGTKATVKYQQIAASVRELGIIEPIVVYPQKGSSGQYLLLDGHIRLEVLKDIGAKTTECLMAHDDESFTYNHKISRLTVVQEHFMIMKAIKNGVSEHDIATALNVDVASIRGKRDLLVGICPEAVQLLKGQRANAGTFNQLRKAKPMRQIEMAELMCSSHNFTVNYAKCLLATTPPEQLVDQVSREVDGLTAADIARMEREMKSLSQDFKQIEETHGKNTVNLIIVVGYLKKLLDNARVVRYMAQHYPEILAEFQKIVESRSREESVDSGREPI